jgi:hypothetical protein
MREWRWRRGRGCWRAPVNKVRRCLGALPYPRRSAGRPARDAAAAIAHLKSVLSAASSLPTDRSTSSPRATVSSVSRLSVSLVARARTHNPVAWRLALSLPFRFPRARRLAGVPTACRVVGARATRSLCAQALGLCSKRPCRPGRMLNHVRSRTPPPLFFFLAPHLALPLASPRAPLPITSLTHTPSP